MNPLAESRFGRPHGSASPGPQGPTHPSSGGAAGGGGSDGTSAAETETASCFRQHDGVPKLSNAHYFLNSDYAKKIMRQNAIAGNFQKTVVVVV
ncbi:hypothetical protein CEXT_369811 [Caerostris extrusa]|uniref:Uncharacterized protein n=1 Tax=Caerostris extrusa TaxID=172846 RepID=A0AAV4UNU7_CAEEX|nr:hypothetical protein CEXT_369811 [Caerostris extrusa]